MIGGSALLSALDSLGEGGLLAFVISLAGLLVFGLWAAMPWMVYLLAARLLDRRFRSSIPGLGATLGGGSFLLLGEISVRLLVLVF